YFNRQQWTKSEELFQQSLQIKREAGDNAGQALTLRNLARVHRAQQRMPDAVAALEQAAALYTEVRDDYNAAQVKRDLARLHRSMKNIKLADDAFDEAIALFERCHEPQEAQATRDEAHPKKRGLPWWVIVAIVLFAALVVLCILAILAVAFKW